MTVSWTSSLVTYQIGDTPAASGSPEAPYTVGMTSLMQSRAALAFELWDDVVQTDFVRVYGRANPDIQFEYSSQTQDDGTYTATGGFYNGFDAYGLLTVALDTAEIWLSSNWWTHDTDADLFFGGYGFQTYLHEIGHSLGLSHPGSYNGATDATFSYLNNAEFAQDTRRYTVMSYFGGYQPGVGWQQDGNESAWLYSSTPMLYDVLAAQAIYGADYNTRNTDTVYGFNSTAGKVVLDFAQNAQPIFTIWDGGGIDTLDTSGFAAQQRIDLNAGTYSNIGGLTQNIAIAFGAVIENAIGGSGNDTILGNGAKNRLTGGAGNDTIDGGDGIDSAIYSGSYAQYTVTDLGGNSVQVAGADGTDTLSNIEKLVFSDQTVVRTPGTVTISDVSIAEGGGGPNAPKVAIFTLTRSGGWPEFSVDYATADGTATVADYDYVATSGTVSFGANVNSQTISVTIRGDPSFEPNETFTVNLSGATNGATIGDAQAIGTITNDDTLPGRIAISDVSIVEGQSGTRLATFTVTRSGGTWSPFSVDYATIDGTATVADGDYAATSGTLYFGNSVTQSFTVEIKGDTKLEADETFQLKLSNATNSAVIGDGQAIGTIVSDDIRVVISDATLAEGNSGTKIATFTVTRTGGTAAFSVDYATADGSATVADGDYLAASGTLSFAAGVNSRTIAVTIKADAMFEADETFKINLSNPTAGATIGDAQAIGTITNDDILPGTVAISDVTIAEGNGGTSVATFTVTRTGGSAPFSVAYATADGSAKVADGDYLAASGTLSFAAGVNSQMIAVTIQGDTRFEADETFRVNLSGATNGAKIADTQAIGTITNDDTQAGTVAISDVTIAEGNGGAKVATFTVTRTGGTAPFSVNYATADGTAKVADGDYLAASGTLSFGAGVDSRTISVKIYGDTRFEADETLRLNLSNATNGARIIDAGAIGTVTNDDAQAGSVAISDMTIAEGNSGSKVATFTVTRTGGTGPFSVNYATADGTAKIADGDYLAASGTLSFGAGINSKTISVRVTGDTRIETDEAFRVNLSGATNGAKIGDTQAIGTITNDDTLPGTVAISDVTIAEGNSGTRAATFTVTRTGGTAAFSVGYTTADNMATASGGDYAATSGTLSFGVGVSSRTIAVTVKGDTSFEADETFRINLSGATNGAKIGDAQAIGTITNDDPGTGMIVIGDAKPNTLRGGADSDVLYGLDGNDTLIGGAALSGGFNLLNGGQGIDTASYAGATSAVTADLALRRGYMNGVLADRMESIENLSGSARNDTLLGDDNANILTGGAGSDQLTGRGGADVFVYKAWSDSNFVAGYDMIGDFVSGTDKIDLTALHTNASHVAFVSINASTMVQVGQNVGVFDSATDLALMVNTSSIVISDFRF